MFFSEHSVDVLDFVIEIRYYCPTDIPLVCLCFTHIPCYNIDPANDCHAYSGCLLSQLDDRSSVTHSISVDNRVFHVVDDIDELTVSLLLWCVAGEPAR